MSAKRITIRLSESDYQTIQTRAAAANTSVAEVVRALAVVGGAGANAEGLADVLAATLSSIAERIEAIESEGTSTAVDLSPALQKIEELAASQARTERAISALVDAVEKLQNQNGYRQENHQQPAPPSYQNREQSGTQNMNAGNMTFTSWKMANPIRDGESPADFNARSRAAFTAAGGRL